MHRARLALVLGTAATLALLAAARPRAPLPAPGEVGHAALAPALALAYAEFRDADGLLGRGLQHPLLQALLAGEVSAILAQRTGRTPQEALDDLDRRAGHAVLPALAELTARGAALSVELRGARPRFLLTLRGADAERVEELLESALARAAELAGFPGALAAPAEVRGDTALWRVGDELVIAQSGTWIAASNEEATVTDALERAHGDGGLAHSESFARAYAGRPLDATLWGWADLERSRALQRLADGGDRGLLELEEAAAEPGVQFLLGPTLALLGGVESMGLALCVRGEDVALHAQGFGCADGAPRRLLPAIDGRTPPCELGPRDALRAALYRDLRGLFVARGELFATRTQPAFAEAESNLALFFGGRDVAEAVLPHLSPWFEVVSREVVFRAEAVPDAALPAVALLARVDDPVTIGADLVSAFQTAISLVNVDRAQKAMPSMRLELSNVEDATLTSARFAAPVPGTGVDLRYNLEPACALVGDTFVVGTHRALVAELVAERSSGATHVRAVGGSERLRLAGATLERLARAQRELLVMGRVLDEGRTRAEAEGEIDLLLGLLGRLEELELVAGRRAEDVLGATLTLDLRARGTQR
ncbi:MAG TPA: hypothetical protein VMT18_02000 [Planctomycetota bacterium]|nr:hypothetical protein [Planctomycetota bacterium]